MAEPHWREHGPQMVAGMERTGTLQQMLVEPRAQTNDMCILRSERPQALLTPEWQQFHGATGE